MRINKWAIFISTSIIATSAFLALKNKLNIKMYEKPEKAIENGISIVDNHFRVLAISAHPDDLEFFAGGLLRLMQLKGKEIFIIDVTDGEKGVRLKNLAQLRRKEQLEAGSALGIRNIQFLHFPDLKLDQVDALDDTIKNHIEEINPDLILTFDYYKPVKAIVHPDHIKVGISSKEAVMQLIGKKPDLLYYASREPNAIVDITECIENKIVAVQKHRSQIRFNTKLYDFFVRSFGKYSSLDFGIKYAESFRIESFNTKD